MGIIADRALQINPSATIQVSAKARQLKAEGKDIISLSAGEPDFDTPQHIQAAAIQAIQSGQTHYTNVDGIPELKQAIIDKLAQDNQLHYQDNQILVSTGAKQCIFNAFAATLNPGDEVIIPTPCWVSYPDIAKLFGGKAIMVPCSEANYFKLTAAQLAEHITEKTKYIVLNSPTNPTGMVYTKAELAALGEVLAQHPNIIVMTDDIYEKITWAQEPYYSFASACPDLIDRCLVINGVSKAYAMTGWRIGYAAGPSDIIAQMKKIQAQSTSCACSISQIAAVAALSGDQTCLTPMIEAFKARHDVVVAGLNAIPGFRCLPASGAFYAFPNVEEAIAQIDGVENDLEFADWLLDKAEVASVPGSAFGTPGYIRLSFATDMDALKTALHRIETALVAATV